jgi:hypothetical protein
MPQALHTCVSTPRDECKGIRGSTLVPNLSISERRLSFCLSPAAPRRHSSLLPRRSSTNHRLAEAPARTTSPAHRRVQLYAVQYTPESACAQEPARAYRTFRKAGGHLGKRGELAAPPSRRLGWGQALSLAVLCGSEAGAERATPHPVRRKARRRSRQTACLWRQHGGWRGRGGGALRRGLLTIESHARATFCAELLPSRSR